VLRVQAWCLNWCCQLLLCSDSELKLVHWWQILEALQLQPQKIRKAIAFTCLWWIIIWLSSVRARQRTCTCRLQDGWVSGSWDTWLQPLCCLRLTRCMKEKRGPFKWNTVYTKSFKTDTLKTKNRRLILMKTWKLTVHQWGSTDNKVQTGNCFQHKFYPKIHCQLCLTNQNYSHIPRFNSNFSLFVVSYLSHAYTGITLNMKLTRNNFN